MKKKSERLKVIIELQALQEQEALQALGRSRQKLQELLTQLEGLQTYRLEYQANLAQKQALGIGINQLLEFRAFADKLDKAIEGQHLALKTQEQEVQRAQVYWEESRQRTKSLQKVSDLALVEELKIENHREQLEQDARASRSSKKDGIRSA
jgi:flagellar protein FliJ